MKRFFYTFLLLAAFTSVGEACEFCTLHNGLGQYNNLGDFVSFTERYTTASATVSNGKLVNAGDPNKGTGGYAIQINTIQAMYQHSFTYDLKGVFSLPYFDKRSSNTANGSDTSSGIGDATAMARYRLWEGHHEQNLWLLAGFKLPTGKEKSTPVSGPSGSGYFNPDLVIGTGSLDELLGFVYSQNIGSFSYAFDALYKNANTGYDGYRFGNVLNLGASGYYRVQNHWNFGLGFVSEIMGTDTDTVGNTTGSVGTVMNTGGSVVFFSPTLQYVNQNNYIDISYQYPVYRNFIGTQTVVDDKIILAYRHAF